MIIFAAVNDLRFIYDDYSRHTMSKFDHGGGKIYTDTFFDGNE